MNTRYLNLICAELFLCVDVLAQNNSAHNKAENQPALNPGTLNLIESMDGAELYKAYCGTCHGTDGKGIGPMTQWLKITAPDLTRIGMRNGGMFPLARVQRIISGEESTTLGHGTREMPVWGPVFSQISRDQDLGRIRVYNLAKFLEKMQTKFSKPTARSCARRCATDAPVAAMPPLGAQKFPSGCVNPDGSRWHLFLSKTIGSPHSARCRRIRIHHDFSSVDTAALEAC